MPAIAAAPPASAAAGSRTPIRVMIADDSAVVRGLVARWLTEAGIEVAATASNGRIALDALARHDPDVVLLDIDMPELDGTQALPLMLARAPGLQVVMMSTLTQRNADISLRCLSLGAIDYIPKPESNRGVTTSDTFRHDLIERIRLFGAARARRRLAAPAGASAQGSSQGPSQGPSQGVSQGPAHATPVPHAPPPRTAAAIGLRARPRSATAPRLLLIGASTGGPRAVGDVLERVGAPILRRVPTLVVQHMPPVFTAVFAEHLGARTGLPAAEGRADERLQPGRIYVAPGGRHMRLAGSSGDPVIRLDDGPVVNFCRPAVDVLFLDAAAMFGPATLSVILTGMGSDGTAGVRALGDAGGVVLAQDEATSTVWGMPGSVARAGLAHAVLPLPEIGPALRAELGGQG